MEGHYSQNYQPLGTLILRNLETTKAEVASNYTRQLDLGTATVDIAYGSGQKRTYFASAPDSVIVARWQASDGEKINRRISFHTLQPHQTVAYVVRGQQTERAPRRIIDHGITKGQSAELCVDGYVGYTSLPSYYQRGTQHFWYDSSRGTHFSVIVNVVTDGVVSCPVADEVCVADATEMTVVMTSVTSFNGANCNPAASGNAYQERATARIDLAVAKGYDAILVRHVEDYRTLFDRVSIDLGATPDSIRRLSTDEQLRRYAQNGERNPDLEELYFQYGRYLLIASSRTPNVPANLQGLWNEYMTPPWSSNYTSNINVEENYWPALTGNLAELNRSLVGFICQLPRTGTESARAYYGVPRGWNLGQNTDIWAMTCPVGMQSGDPSWACWTMGGAWLSTHLWEHYSFTMDKEFLADVYPTLRGAADFCIGWLVEKDGYLMTSPGTSPENKYKMENGHVGSVLYGATADIAMTRECLLDARAAAEVLGIDADYRDTISDVLNRLLPYRVGSRGNLQEWYHDWEDSDPQHRHQSHLFGLYPGHHLTVETTPALAEACRRTLEIKGDNTTGWSTGWRVNLYARLHDGEGAYHIYRKLLTYVSPDEYRGPDAVHRGGTYPNLLDAHPPFQIDGNFGGAAGVMEMLVQSTLAADGSSVVDLLPALPEAWRGEGTLHGVRVRGGMIVDLSWRDGRLTTLAVRSMRGDRSVVSLRHGDKRWLVKLAAGQKKVVIR